MTTASLPAARLDLHPARYKVVPRVDAQECRLYQHGANLYFGFTHRNVGWTGTVQSVHRIHSAMRLLQAWCNSALRTYEGVRFVPRCKFAPRISIHAGVWFVPGPRDDRYMTIRAEWRVPAVPSNRHAQYIFGPLFGGRFVGTVNLEVQSAMWRPAGSSEFVQFPFKMCDVEAKEKTLPGL